MSLIKFDPAIEPNPSQLSRAVRRHKGDSAEACFCRLAGPAVWCTAPRQTRRTTSGSRVVKRSRAFNLCELFSITLEPCEVGFQAPPAAGSGGKERASRTEQNRPRLASIINGNFGYDHLAPHPFFWILLAPQIQHAFNDATRSLCGAVWRAGSVAAHWKYRMKPLVDREKAVGLRHAPRLHPSLTLPLLLAGALLDSSVAWAHDRCPASGIAGGGGDQHPGVAGAGRQHLRASQGAPRPPGLEFVPNRPHPACGC